MTSAPLPSDPAAQRAFVLAGRAVFTVQNAATGGRFTYRVSRGKTPMLWFVSVLSGCDNEHDYSYLGTVRGPLPVIRMQSDLDQVWAKSRAPFKYHFRRGLKSPVRADAPSVIAFRWLWDKHLAAGRPLPPSVTLYHQGRCGKCGRPLTVPSSVTAGYGPECQGRT
jgi:hypothetical protein